jgi:hypothetical protein
MGDFENFVSMTTTDGYMKIMPLSIRVTMTPMKIARMGLNAPK